MADNSQSHTQQLFKTSLWGLLLVLALTAIYVATSKGTQKFFPAEADVDMQSASEAQAPSPTATLDVFLPAESCAEVVSQDYEQNLQHVNFEVLCRDATSNYSGFHAYLKLDSPYSRVSRFDYHLSDQEEMTLAER
jgi:hypothetical protein